jgi:hypothetical protein
MRRALFSVNDTTPLQNINCSSQGALRMSILDVAKDGLNSFIQRPFLVIKGVLLDKASFAEQT